MIHIVPANDAEEHDLHEFCHCNPVVKAGLVIHNAFDGREVFEQAMELIKNMN